MFVSPCLALKICLSNEGDENRLGLLFLSQCNFVGLSRRVNDLCCLKEQVQKLVMRLPKIVHCFKK